DNDPVAEIAAVSRALAASGVTGVTEATPDATATSTAALAGAVADGRILQRLHLMCPPGVAPPYVDLVTRGPHKLVLHDDGLPALGELVALVRRSHDAGVPVAVHCVTAAQLALAAAAFEEAGAVEGDRIEHGSVIPAGFVPVLSRLRLTVVTNPSFVATRGDAYLRDVDEADRGDLYRCASLLHAGVAVAAGTDAPFGSPDPFTAVRAAVTRRTQGGRPLGPHEAVDLRTAFALFTGEAAAPAHPRRLAPGEPGDLCVVADGPLPGPGQPPPVRATVVAGRVVFEA
ncbi:MAG TPA: amidohydrolase family protein, partial [Acidimicrobiales bacterium]|nr:amidohydrolase family protein [Acidimicrobiales bacterium]